MIRHSLLLCTALVACLPARSEVKPEPPQQFIERSYAALQNLQAVNDSSWKMQEAERWSVDQKAGRIMFVFRDGTTASAPVQVVGSFSPQNNSFMWAWANPSLDERLTRASRAAKAWADANSVSKWANRSFPSSEAEAWEITAVAARLDGAMGAYRAPTGGPVVFLVFGEVKLVKQ